MATQYEQELVGQYGAPMQSFIEAERAKGRQGLLGGVNVDKGDISRIVSAFQVNPGQVYTSSNIANANTNPTHAPDDLLGIRNQIGTELGISGLESGYQTAFGELQKAKDLARQQQTAIEGLPQALRVIRGEQAQAGRLASDRITGLSEAAQVAQSALQAAKQEQESRFSIRQSEVEQKRSLILNNPGAGITFGDSIESARAKLQKYEDNKAKEVEKKRAEELKSAEKSDLKKMALQLGLKTSGSRKDLEKRIAKKVKEDEAFDRSLKLSSGSGKEDAALEKEKTAFFNEATSLRSNIIEKKKGWNWGTAWQTMKNKYPDVPNEAIDEALGLDLRNQWFK